MRRSDRQRVSRECYQYLAQECSGCVYGARNTQYLQLKTMIEVAWDAPAQKSFPCNLSTLQPLHTCATTAFLCASTALMRANTRCLG